MNEFHPNPNLPMGSEITQFMRGLIRLGKLSAEQKLPTTSALAKMWGTHAPVVHRALVPLVKEGLLRRVPKLGTVVQPVARQLSTIGIYLFKDIWHEGHGTYRALCRFLTSEATDRGIKVEFFVDSRPLDQQFTAYEPLVAAIRMGNIQAVIAPCRTQEHLKWLTQLDVPFISYATFVEDFTVGKDCRELVTKGLVGLARQGCRSVGFISTLNLDRAIIHPNDRPGDFRKYVMEQAAVLGLELRPQWVVQPVKSEDIPEQDAREFGNQAIHHIWAMSDRPKGLLVYTDVAAMGVLDAVFELGIRVPEELALVMHRNEGVPLRCPVPASFLHVSLPEAASIMIGHVERQFRGEPAEHVWVGIKLVREVGPRRLLEKDRPGESEAPASPALEIEQQN